MSETFVLDITEREFIKGEFARYCASGKPRNDTITTLCEMGATLIELRTLPIMTAPNKYIKKILKHLNVFHLLAQNHYQCGNIHDAIMFIQYPFISCSQYVAKHILQTLHNNGNKLIFIIHDIESVRQKDCKNIDKGLLDLADVAIVHSHQMGQALHKIINNDVNTVSLGFFDYRSSLNVPIQQDYRNVCLIFAGNLYRASFVKKLNELPFDKNFQINLYGIKSPLVQVSKYVHYKGKFDANDYSTIEGNWGLVWDGESLNTCSGDFGEYLRINASFKLSLYLAAHRPVIVWKNSAMAQYVEQLHLGICVESLYDIYDAISNLSDTEIYEIKHGVEMASEEVRKGSRLRLASQKAINIIRNAQKV